MYVGCTSSLMFLGSTSGTTIVRKMWFFSASVLEERWAQVTRFQMLVYDGVARSFLTAAYLLA